MYERGWLQGDLVAGVALAALVIPKSRLPGPSSGLAAVAAGAVLAAGISSGADVASFAAAGLCEHLAPAGRFPLLLGRSFRDHAPAGLPVTAVAALCWLWDST